MDQKTEGTRVRQEDELDSGTQVEGKDLPLDLSGFETLQQTFGTGAMSARSSRRPRHPGGNPPRGASARGRVSARRQPRQQPLVHPLHQQVRQLRHIRVAPRAQPHRAHY